MARLSTPSPPAGPQWTLPELRSLAESILATQIAPESGRVRAIPDERTLRYYTTIGLLPRPSSMKGRTAYYTRIHLAHVVAIKRLQALGMSLAQVQMELAGSTPREIEILAALPEELPDPLLVASPEPLAAKRAFWAEPVAEQGRPAISLRSGIWLELAAGAVLLLPVEEMPTEMGLKALFEAAGPLREEIARQGLIPPQHSTGDNNG